jgi:hypothetical protein
MDNAEPRRAKARSDKELPNVLKSSTDNDEPQSDMP